MVKEHRSNPIQDFISSLKFKHPMSIANVFHNTLCRLNIFA